LVGRERRPAHLARRAHAPLFGPRPDNGWDEKRVGGNGAPIETDAGWMLLYHAYNKQHVYRLGVALLDRANPGIVPARPLAPIFEPEELWELRGDVPNVVFSCTNPVVDGKSMSTMGAPTTSSAWPRAPWPTY
jgi:predicted GH43/DUF377 family glycosyl hydrolase